MLTGQKFAISFLLGFPLASGTTRTIFGKSRKMLRSMLELINFVKSGVKNSRLLLSVLGEWSLLQ